MSEHETVAEVVRARRVELVDEQGRLRGVLGEIGEFAPSPDPVIGLELYAPSGEPRLSLAMGGDTAWVLLEVGGNAQVQIGVNEAKTGAVAARAFLILCDADGVPVLGWRVDDDGAVAEVPS